jgi:hypothetical protein
MVLAFPISNVGLLPVVSPTQRVQQECAGLSVTGHSKATTPAGKRQ